MLLYQKMYEQLLDDLEKGVYPVNTLLPTEPELEKLFGVSRTTVRRAVARLASEGYVRVRQGHGTVVLHNIYRGTPQVNERFRKFHNVVSVNEVYRKPDEDLTVRGMYIDRVPADTAVATALQLPPDTPVFRIQRIAYQGAVPFNLTTNYLSVALCPDLDRHSGDFIDLYPFLEKQYNVVFRQGTEYISAVAADLIDSQLLHVPTGTPLLSSRRYAHSNQGPMEYMVANYRVDVMEFCIYMEGPPVK